MMRFAIATTLFLMGCVEAGDGVAIASCEHLH